MADLDKILKFVVVDVESRQTIAAFAQRSSALKWKDDLELRTGREFKIDFRG